MATQVQFRRGTEAQNNSFIGAAGEITVNSNNNSIRVHDNSTQGGHELAKDNLSNTQNVGVLTASSFVKSGGTSSQFLKADGSVDSTSYATSVDGGNADQLDGQEGTYYLNYNNFTNTPTIPTNNNQLTNGAGYITTSFTSYNQLSDKPTIPTNNNQLTNGAGYITTSFTSYNQLSDTPTVPTNTSDLTNDSNFVTSSSNISGTAAGLSGAPSITVSDITAVGNVSIAGTLTYEDVASIDSVGIVTARKGVKITTGGIEVSSGGLDVTGVSTFTGNINVSGTVDGRDVASDGSKLDGIESGATADQSGAEILTAIKTVDGPSSGLNADQLDGQEGSYYLDYDNFSNTPTVPTNNNQLTNGAGYITTSFTNTNQLTNGANFVTASDSISGVSAGLSGSPTISVSAVNASSKITAYSDLEVSGHTELSTSEISGIATFANDVYFDSGKSIRTDLLIRKDSSNLPTISLFRDSTISGVTGPDDLSTDDIGTVNFNYLNSSTQKSFARVVGHKYSNNNGGLTFQVISNGGSSAVKTLSINPDTIKTLNGVNFTVAGVTTLSNNLNVSGESDFDGNLNVTGIITASSFIGDGSSLTGILSTANLTGYATEGYVDNLVSISTFSGDYNDLTNTPAGLSTEGLATEAFVGLATVGLASITYVDTQIGIRTFSGDYNDLSNRPDILQTVSSNGYATQSYVDSAVGFATEGLSTTSYVDSEISSAVVGLVTEGYVDLRTRDLVDHRLNYFRDGEVTLTTGADTLIQWNGTLTSNGIPDFTYSNGVFTNTSSRTRRFIFHMEISLVITGVNLFTETNLWYTVNGTTSSNNRKGQATFTNPEGTTNNRLQSSWIFTMAQNDTVRGYVWAQSAAKYGNNSTGYPFGNRYGTQIEINELD